MEDEGGDVFVLRWGGRAKVEVSEAQVYAFLCMMTGEKMNDQRLDSLLEAVDQQNKGGCLVVLFTTIPRNFSTLFSKDFHLAHHGTRNFEHDVVTEVVESGTPSEPIELKSDDNNDHAEGGLSQGYARESPREPGDIRRSSGRRRSLRSSS